MFRDFLITDSSGKGSTTLTAFVIGFIVVNAKLILAGIEVAGIKFPEFTGADYGLCISALGGVYILRKRTNATAETKSEEK